MDVSDIWDWEFMWSMFRNFMATASPFVMIPVAAAVMTMVIGGIVSIVRARRTD